MLLYESVQIARNLAEHRYDLEQSRATSAEESGSMVASSSEIGAMTDHLFLTTEGLENQLRYEAMINRQLNHASAELELVQAARKRKKCAPTSVELRNKPKKSFSFSGE